VGVVGGGGQFSGRLESGRLIFFEAACVTTCWSHTPRRSHVSDHLSWPGKRERECVRERERESVCERERERVRERESSNAHTLENL